MGLKDKELILIGYSGHAYVICDIFHSQNKKISSYCEKKEKKFNPYQLNHLGSERNPNTLEQLKKTDYFIAIGDNYIRRKVTTFLYDSLHSSPINAVHSKAYIASNCEIGKGVMVGNQVIINPCTTIGNGVVCYTSCIIEHECKIGDFAYIAPGAIVCGNVSIGANSFIGAGAVIKQGITIGQDVIIGAGTVVIRDIPSGTKVVGNPQRQI